MKDQLKACRRVIGKEREGKKGRREHMKARVEQEGGE